MQKGGEYLVIATKVKPEVKRQIGKLCKQKKLTEYGMLQMVCDCLVRYMDDQHNLSPELEQAMSVFEHMEGWKDALNLADPTVKKEICEAVYIQQDKEGKKKGFRCSMVTKPIMGEWTHTDNVVYIYERMTEVLLPEIYRKMRLLAAEMDCNSIVDLLHSMIDAQAVIQLNEGFRKEFEDADRATNGKPVAYGQRTRRKKHYDPDTMPEQRLRFDERKDDGLEDDLGFRPHGGEW